MVLYKYQLPEVQVLVTDKMQQTIDVHIQKMSTPRTIAGLVDAIAFRSPSKLALISPFQEIGTKKYTYGELSKATQAMAAFLSVYGYERNDIIVSDLPNTTENIIVQLACNRIGVGYGTAKSIEGMAKQFVKVKGSISTNSSGFLAETNLPVPYLSGDYVTELIHHGGLKDFFDEIHDNDDVENVSEDAHGFYNTDKPYTNSQALYDGKQAHWNLAMSSDDIVCISVTLSHPFGIGSALCSTLLAGGTVALPGVGGIQGCGIPSQRASATYDTLQNENCTLLFADTHTYKALPPNIQPHDLKSLRGGVCKVGSGSDFLNETLSLAGVQLRTMGKKTESS